MRPQIPIVLLILLLCFSSVAAKDDITKELITSGGKTRPYYLYVPSTIKTNAPLIIMLHGSGDTLRMVQISCAIWWKS
jgi:poly(3-hydroxybutyrate) depolymerase